MKIALNISPKKTALFLLLVWCIPIITSARPISVQQEVSSDEYFEMAENAYYDEEFAAAIKFANHYLEQKNLTNESKENAHILLAHIYLATNDSVLAEESVINILKINSEYAPTLEMEIPKYVNFVNKIREKYFSSPPPVAMDSAVQDSLNINWYYVGGAGAALTVLTILLLSGDDSNTKDQPLSLPPELPQ